MRERGPATTITMAAVWAQRLYKLKKSRPLYKALPFLNPEPKLVKYGNDTELLGEPYMGMRDRWALTERLEEKYNKLLSKINKNKSN